MKRYVLALMVSFSASFAFAAEDLAYGELLAGVEEFQNQKNAPPMPPDHPCVKLNLTEAQKSSIKEIMYQGEQEGIQHQANIKKAMLTSLHTLSSSKSTKQEGEDSQTALQNALAAAGKAQSTVVLNINYDVLQPDQRENALLCAMFMRKHRPGPGGEHGARPRP